MSIDPAAFAFSMTTVVIAEMGDKTQLLAMAFATRYRWWKVMVGVFAATLLNHALAVALGSVLGRIEAAHAVVQILASASFVVFGLWTLKGDRLGDEARRKSRLGPVLTVAVAFFLAEIGDKTQVATIALAAKYPTSPIGVLLGTTLGMVIADAVGIVVGVLFCRQIPERIVKSGSALVFVVFGLASTFQLFREELGMSLGWALAAIAAIAAATAAAGSRLVRGTASSASPPEVVVSCEERDRIA